MPRDNHLVGFDLLKIVFVPFIVYFHSWEMLVDATYQQMTALNPMLNIALDTIRSMSFSGIAVVCLYAFLFGFCGFAKDVLKRLMGVCLLGTVFLFLIFESTSWFHLWDIYAYLGMVILLIQVVGNHFRLIVVLFLFSMVGLAVPSEVIVRPFGLSHNQGTYITEWQAIIFGVCGPHLETSWPVVPNLFYSMVSFCWGAILRYVFSFHNSRAKWVGLIWLVPTLIFFKD
ncbi:MAG: hypothetical protein NZ480_01920, partial [Bdellovibrionaceae bacterium]|nr:hypothetical protein [Pseudobdellovibrionaceae bacterium]MDW8191006.1 hypothetical protein [Pseudobdellovibrionaceae bacterium]